jgi:hypothetical protein
VKQEHCRTFNHDILSARQQGIVKGDINPLQKQQLFVKEAQILPSFAAQCGKLKASPQGMHCALQRKWKQYLAGVALLLSLGQAPALAATINVNSTCTLARAIVSANQDASRFCTPGSGADTIVLPPNSTQTLTAVNNTNFGPTGLPTVYSVITVVGNDSRITRAPTAPSFRILAVGIGGNLTLQRVTVSGGFAPTIAGNTTANDGGAVLNLGGTLTIVNSTVASNSADRGGGVASQGAPPSFARVSVTVVDSTFSGIPLLQAVNSPLAGAAA